MVKNSIDNPVFLIFLLIFAVSINFLASTHFLVILFAGVISTAFYRTLKQKYYYSFAFVIIAFLLIELNMGLKPFSLSLLSYFVYLFIIYYKPNCNLKISGATPNAINAIIIKIATIL